MSKIALSGNPSGTGTFTIASPNSNTDRTLTLPDNTGTVALTSQIPAAPTISSTAEAQAGTNNTNFITPLRMREGFNASGDAPVYACRAWAIFQPNGTTLASGNVSSIQRNNVGDYTITFTTAMVDANYSAFVATQNDNMTLAVWGVVRTATTTSIQVLTGAGHNPGVTSGDVAERGNVRVGVFR